MAQYEVEDRSGGKCGSISTSKHASYIGASFFVSPRLKKELHSGCVTIVRGFYQCRVAVLEHRRKEDEIVVEQRTIQM
jgi:hypothetical protein